MGLLLSYGAPFDILLRNLFLTGNFGTVIVHGGDDRDETGAQTQISNSKGYPPNSGLGPSTAGTVDPSSEVRYFHRPSFVNSVPSMKR